MCVVVVIVVMVVVVVVVLVVVCVCVCVCTCLHGGHEPVKTRCRLSGLPFSIALCLILFIKGLSLSLEFAGSGGWTTSPEPPLSPPLLQCPCPWVQVPDNALLVS